jgi:hypothetical protein
LRSGGTACTLGDGGTAYRTEVAGMSWCERRLPLLLGLGGLSPSDDEEASDEKLPRRACRGWLCRRLCRSSGGLRSGPRWGEVGDETGEEPRFSGTERRRERAKRGEVSSGARN